MTSVAAILLAKLEAASEGSRELDGELWCVLNGYEWVRWDGAGASYSREGDRCHENANRIDPYTFSLDAALALCDRVLPEWTAWELRSRRRKTAFVAELSRLDREGGWGELSEAGHGPTPALAMCIAILKAKFPG